MKKPIYFDYNATTPLDPKVLDAMLPYLKEEFGNPASKTHAYGWEASSAVEKARQQVAQVIGADKKEVLFTSGATESNNMAIIGFLNSCAGQKSHIITSNVEHKAVLDVCHYVKAHGTEVTFVPVDSHGQIHPEQIEKALRPHTKMISIMMANNEIGTINPIAKIGALAHKHGVVFHTDAAQTFGKVPIDVSSMHIDLLSISAHKIYGPKGIGALYVRSKNPEVNLKPIAFGGLQEKGLRPGTLNVPGIVGLGTAAQLAHNLLSEESQRLTQWRDQIINQVLSSVSSARLNGHPSKRLCNNISFSFNNLNADVFALGLSGLALSSGSACTSESARPSHVLLALGHDEALARATLRIGLGRMTTPEDVNVVVDKIVKMAQKNLSSMVLN